MYLIYRVVMTLKAICDKCGKEITLRYLEQGFENPSGWGMTTVFSPLTRDYSYRTFCPKCNPKVVRKAEE